MTEEELDRETERLFAAARREKPAGGLREQVMRGVARGERARARARRVATFGWAAVAAGAGGLVWLGASAMDGAPNLGAEPERTGAYQAAPELSSVQAPPVAPSVNVTPVPATTVAVPAPSASVKARHPVRVAAPVVTSSSALVPPSASAAPAAGEPPPPKPDLSKALEERK